MSNRTKLWNIFQRMGDVPHEVRQPPVTLRAAVRRSTKLAESFLAAGFVPSLEDSVAALVAGLPTLKWAHRNGFPLAPPRMKRFSPSLATPLQIAAESGREKELDYVLASASHDDASLSVTPIHSCS